jgi:hypothetical protein
LEVFAPLLKGRLLEDAFAFTYPSVVITENLDSFLSQIAGPPDPGIIRIVPL